MRRLPPLPGELLSSCLARNAFAHGLPPYRFFNLIWDHDPVWDRDFDREPDELTRAGKPRRGQGWFDDVAGHLGIPRDDVRAATLSDWRHTLTGGQPSRFGDTPLILSAGVHHRTRSCHGLQYCPACLQEGIPFFRKIWRLAFVVECPTHHVRLRDACPHCDAPVIPHRSMTMRLTDCHACARSLMTGKGRIEQSAPDIPSEVATLQAGLLAMLDGGTAHLGEHRQREATFQTLRTLIAASAPPIIRARLDAGLAVLATPASDSRMRFEHLRIDQRVAWLATIAAWTEDWPHRFRSGAHSAGLTRRSFRRCLQPDALAAEIRRLPPGQTRDRSWKPVIEGDDMKLLRRSDATIYREVRAKRIVAYVRERNQPGPAATAGQKELLV